MKKALLFVTVFSMLFYGTVVVSEQAMTPYENTEVGVLPESYGASSESCGVMGSNLDLPGWTPVSELRTAAPIIEDTPPVRGPAQPINRGATTNASSNNSCTGNVCNGYRYVNNGCCYRYYRCHGNYYQRPICGGYYRHWNYRCGQPVRNVVRFFHNRRPVRRAIGWIFGCR